MDADKTSVHVKFFKSKYSNHVQNIERALRFCCAFWRKRYTFVHISWDLRSKTVSLLSIILLVYFSLRCSINVNRGAPLVMGRTYLIRYLDSGRLILDCTVHLYVFKLQGPSPLILSLNPTGLIVECSRLHSMLLQPPSTSQPWGC